MTHDPVRRPANDDTTKRKHRGDRDPQIVTRHELLAESMPSVLAQLRPIDPTSDGILRYFGTRDSQARRRNAARRARS